VNNIISKWDDEKIEKKIIEVKSILNINYFPSRKDLELVGWKDLSSIIQKTGGFLYWQKKINLPSRNPRYKWNDQSIQEGIFKTMKLFNIDHMPSSSQIVKSFENNSLHCAICKSLGYDGWAEKLNLKLNISETNFGNKYEDICTNFLINKGYSAIKMSNGYSFDILINNNIKIDVKSGCAYFLRGSRVHTFATNKKFPTCDIYILYALNENDTEIERTFVIPSIFANVISICMGKKSKYNKFIDRWDYINQYDKFYESVI